MRDSDPFDVLVAVCAVLVILIICAVAFIDCRAKSECRDSGGHVVEYNCRTVMMPMSCGKGCTMFVPMETCDWRCEGGAP